MGLLRRVAALHSLPLKRRLLRIRERILRLERRHRNSRRRLRAIISLRRFLAHRLQLLSLPAQAADLDSACFRDEVTHTEILSYPEPSGVGKECSRSRVASGTVSAFLSLPT